MVRSASLTVFIVVGSIGFIADAGLTTLLIFAGLSSLVARPPAIAVAMLLTWLMNRTYAFKTQSPKSLGEFLRYVGVAVSVSLLNYAIYALCVVFGVMPLVAIMIATCAQVGVSYLAYRNFVFGA